MQSCLQGPTNDEIVGNFHYFWSEILSAEILGIYSQLECNLQSAAMVHDKIIHGGIWWAFFKRKTALRSAPVAV